MVCVLCACLHKHGWHAKLTDLKEGRGVHAKAIGARLSHKTQSPGVVHGQEGIERHTAKRSGLGLRLGFVLR